MRVTGAVVVVGCIAGSYKWSGWTGVALAGGGLCVGLILPLITAPKKAKFEGGYEELDHTLLNIVADTQWMNLGMWSVATPMNGKTPELYHVACARLAHHLGNFCSLSPNDSVLDVGFGRGQQCLYWFDTFEIKSLVGVNISPNEVAAAQAKLGRTQHKEKVRFEVGSATALEAVAKGEQFSVVLSLDSAYHYAPSRVGFLEQSFAALQPGGRFAAADIVAVRPLSSWSFPARCILRMVCTFSSLPESNLVTLVEYEAQLKAIGYTDIRSESIGADVFPGFASFLRRHERTLEGVAQTHVWRRYRLVASLADYVHFNDVLDFVVVTAKKPE